MRGDFFQSTLSGMKVGLDDRAVGGGNMTIADIRVIIGIA
jgi:hypothetical protein